jgi:fructose-1,6-bisphosphatase II
MDRLLALDMVRVTEAAALAAARHMGRGDEEAADAAAVHAMREEFNRADIHGTVVIGEGERDEAPMLYIGEEVGKRGPESTRCDIALDPLEGTTLTAHGDYNALAVLAIAEPGNLLHAPDTYMKKIAVGPECADVIDIRDSPTANLQRVAEQLGRRVSEITAVILDRERHTELIAEVREAGARIRLIRDGDVSAAIAAAVPGGPVDILLGIGGAPEGVLAAAALTAIGGGMQGEMVWRSDAERERAIGMGIGDPDRIFDLKDMVRGDCVFVASGVTDGDFLKGVQFTARGAKTHSVVMRSASGTVRWIEAHHDFRRGHGRPYLK